MSWPPTVVPGTVRLSPTRAADPWARTATLAARSADARARRHERARRLDHDDVHQTAVMIEIAGECSSCQHPWNLHPVAARIVRYCAECIYEEDVDARTSDDMCDRVPPALEVAASRYLSVRRHRDG